MTGNFHCMSIDKEMRKGIMKIMVLSYIARHNTYPYAMLKTMKAAARLHGGRFGSAITSSITKNDIYNLTSSLEKEGYIKSRMQLKGGRAQKMFTITKKGEDIVQNKDKIFKDTFMALKKLVKAEFLG